MGNKTEKRGRELIIGEKTEKMGGGS